MNTVETLFLTRHESLELLQPGSSSLADSWHECSDGNPFRDHAWLLSWWRQIPAQDAQALVLFAKDAAHRIIGILPLHRLTPRSRTWRSWGDGNTCSDHQSLVCLSENRDCVANLFAQELARISRDPVKGWSKLLLDGVLAGDPRIRALVSELQLRGGSIHCHSRMNLWFKQACEDWDTFLINQSKRLRSRLRQLLRSFDDDERWSIRCFDGNSRDLHEATDLLIDLHQKRWNSIGVPGTYSEPRTRQFLHDFLQSHCCVGEVYLPVLYYNQAPVAAELHVIGGDGRFHCYTSGVDLEQSELTPGVMLNALTLRHLHQVGACGVDFMRGDEEYKSRLSADPIPILVVQITAPTLQGRICQTYEDLNWNLRQWSRKSLGRPLVRSLSVQEAFSDEYALSPCHCGARRDLALR